MAHFILIEDSQGDLIDLEIHCSDFCAQYSTFYAGWNGCQEVEFDTTCRHCGDTIPGEKGAYEG